MSPRGLVALATLALFLSGAPAPGATAKVWRITSAADFLAGEGEGIAVSSGGAVVLAPSFDRVAEVDASFVWALAPDRRGGLYLGTGNDGKLFHIPPSGGSPTLVLDTEETACQSVVVGRDGAVYVGTMPHGKIYHLKADGQIEAIVETGQEYVWDLTLDPEGRLVAGTGPDGLVLRLHQSGEADTLLDSPGRHVMTLTLDPEHLYAGTEGPGLVYQITRDDQVRALYDAGQAEVHDLAVSGDGAVFAAVIRGAPPPRPPLSAEAPSPPNGVPIPRGRPSGGGGDGRPTEGRALLYRIAPDSTALEIWRSPEPLLLSLALGGDGRVYAGTGGQGRLFSIAQDGSDWKRIAEGEEANALALVPHDKGSLYVALGDPGAVRLLGLTPGRSGRYTSEAFDTGTVSAFGLLRWHAETSPKTKVAFLTRSGNTAKPDETWSSWSEPLRDPNGSRITSPPARFVQFQTEFSSSKGVRPLALHEVRLPYLPRNLPPRVEEVETFVYKGPPQPPRPQGKGVELQRGPPQGAIDARRAPKPRRGLQMVTWKAVDPNDDRLEFTLYLRPVDEQPWQLLAERVEKPSFVWDTETVPDGRYTTKVVASDMLDNPARTMLEGMRESDPFVVDHTPPRLGELEARVLADGIVVVTAEVRDALSAIKSVEYVVDTRQWMMVGAEDGLLDGPRERVRFRVGGLKSGRHAIVVKATDALDNVSTAGLFVDVP